jgi:hypothetical protein
MTLVYAYNRRRRQSRIGEGVDRILCDMAPPLNPKDERTRACRLAVESLIEKHGGQKAVERETNLSQQSISKFLKQGSIGLDFADEIAAVYETTIDGLVWRFVRGGEGAVRAGNIPGWSKAVAELRERHADLFDWDAAAEVILPVAPRVAELDFVRALAQLITVYCSSTSTRIRAVKSRV